MSTEARIDLRKLRIASPCSERWADMTGDERMRHCAKCRLNVFNFAELSVAEIEALLRERQGRVCARLYRRRDGTVITRDCPVGVRKVRVRAAAAFALAIGLVLAMVASLRRSPASSAPGPFWIRVTRSARIIEDRARALPVIGAAIEWIDPAPPVMKMGDVAGP